MPQSAIIYDRTIGKGSTHAFSCPWRTYTKNNMTDRRMEARIQMNERNAECTRAPCAHRLKHRTSPRGAQGQ